MFGKRKMGLVENPKGRIFLVEFTDKEMLNARDGTPMLYVNSLTSVHSKFTSKGLIKPDVSHPNGRGLFFAFDRRDR
jgi:hypothetical protein